MEVTKALTFRASSIGDCLMGKYLLENVHAEFPEAKLGLVVASRGGMLRDLLKSSPYIEVIEANRRDTLGLFQLWKKFHGADLVVTQYAGKPGGSFSLMSKLFGRLLARRGGLLGFEDASSFNSYLFDQTVGGVLGTEPAELERQALEAAGVPVSLKHPTLSFNRIAGLLERFGLQKGQYVVVHLFAGNRGRGLSPIKKKELLQALHTAMPTVVLVLTGGEGDVEEAQTAAEDLPAVVLAGKTSLQEMMELMMECVGVVSIDTGGAHIAAQLKKPLVVLATCLGLHWWKPEQYGSSAPAQLFTYTESAGHVFKDYPDCLGRINMKEVATKTAAYFLINK